MITNPQARSFLERLQDHYEGNKRGFNRLGDWLNKHTTINGKAFSFKDHEFQEDICNTEELVVSVTKPSQCGLSEISARMALGTLAMNPGTVSIYALQTVLFSSRFFKSRIDAVIQGSPLMKSMLTPASDSASFKQFTNGSQLHGAGFSPGIEVISIPAYALYCDELDRMGQEALRTAESRLSHSPFIDDKGNRGLRRYFSTPTVSGWGISALFEEGDQRKRLVKCAHCNEWTWPDFLEHGVVDEYDGSFRDLTAVEVQNLHARGLLSTGRLLCPSCHGVITQANLADLSKRQWVAAYPESHRNQSWAVSPFDLPTYHSVESLLKKQLFYGDMARNHFVNFSLGLPFNDSTSGVLAGVVEANMLIDPVHPDQAAAQGVRGCVLGMDIGVISWVTVGKLVNGKLHIIWREQIKITSANGGELQDRVVYLLRAFGCVLAVIDNRPYTDVVYSIMSHHSGVRGAEFTIRESSLPIYLAKEESNTISINRTKALDLLVKKVNSSEITFPRGNETLLMAKHLSALKRIEQVKETGDRTVSWVNNNKDDHYGFSLLYCLLSADILQNTYVNTFAPAPSIKQVTVGSKYHPALAA